MCDWLLAVLLVGCTDDRSAPAPDDPPAPAPDEPEPESTAAPEPCATREVAAGADLYLDPSELDEDPDGNPLEVLDTSFHTIFTQIVVTDLSAEEAQAGCSTDLLFEGEEHITLVRTPMVKGVIEGEWLPDGRATFVSVYPLTLNQGWFLNVLLLPTTESSTTELVLTTDMWID